MNDPDVQAAFSSGYAPPPAPPGASDPDVAAAFAPPPTAPVMPGYKAWTGSPMELRGVESGGPVSAAIGGANEWAGNWLQRAARAVGITDPESLRDVHALPQAIELVVGGKSAVPGPKAPELEDIQTSLDRAAANSPQSMGAAAAAPQVRAASPDLQQAVLSAARKNGGAVNMGATVRQLQADSLPVPVRLTEGQATQDPQLLSLEQNGRGANPVLANHFQQQNQTLVQNLERVRDNVGPEVFSANPIEHGDTLIQAYKAKDAAAQADISAKYKALTDANGGNLPFDGVSFADATNAALKKQMKAPFLPAPVRSIIDQYAGGVPMTFENFENLRTTLASAARTAERSGDGNAAAAIGIARNQLENMPITAAAGPVKALADQARAAAKARFDALRADPAYNAAVNETIPPDRFVSRFVTGPSATRDGISTMRQNLAGNDTAQQTISVAGVDHLRHQAGVDQPGNVNFSQAGFNKALQTLQGRGVFDPQTSETLGNLGEVARATQFQPRGSFVNNSNTLVGALGETGANLVEHGANIAAKGLPVGTIARKVLSSRAAAKAAQKAVAPGAGIDRIDLPAR